MIQKDVVLVQEVKYRGNVLQYPRMRGFPQELFQYLMFDQPLNQDRREIVPQSRHANQLSEYLEPDDLLLHLRVVSQQPVHQPKDVLLRMLGVLSCDVCDSRCVFLDFSLLHQQEVFDVDALFVLQEIGISSFRVRSSRYEQSISGQILD